MEPKINLDTVALRYFKVAAELRSVRRAAEALHVSPSSLSRQIGQLEQTLDVRLFERLPRGLKLTSAGEVLLYHVDRSFQEVNRAVDQIDALKGLRRGHIKVVSIESAARGILTSGLSTFWQKHPKIEVSVKVAGNSEVLRLLDEGEADLGLAFYAPGRAPARTNPPVYAMATMSISAVVAKSHPLATRASLALHDLAGYPLLISDSSLMLNTALGAALDTMPLSVRLVTNSITVMSLLASLGDGIALKTKAGLGPALEGGELVIVPFKDQVFPLQRLAIFTRRGLPPPGLANSLAQELKFALVAMDEGTN